MALIKWLHFGVWISRGTCLGTKKALPLRKSSWEVVFHCKNGRVWGDNEITLMLSRTRWAFLSRIIRVRFLQL